jgi:hypothetical protein
MRTIFLMAAFFAFSCTAPVLSGEIIKETRNVDNFTAVDLAISADVMLLQGPSQSVVIEGDKSSLEDVETVVKDGALKIRAKNGFHGNIGNVTVYVTVPEIHEVCVAGSGDITAKTDIKADEIDMTVSGSGSIHFKNLIAREVDATITGSGDIDIASGQAANELDVEITGSGSYASIDFSAQEVDVTITGSGSAKVWAVKELDTHITGSGNVEFKGNPQVEANSTGSGRTRSIQ